MADSCEQGGYEVEAETDRFLPSFSACSAFLCASARFIRGSFEQDEPL